MTISHADAEYRTTERGGIEYLAYIVKYQ